MTYDETKEPDRWISVSDRLPEEGVEVLTYTNILGPTMVLAKRLESGWEETWSGASIHWTVTHWQALPKPPMSIADMARKRYQEAYEFQANEMALALRGVSAALTEPEKE